MTEPLIKYIQQNILQYMASHAPKTDAELMYINSTVLTISIIFMNSAD